MYEQAETGLLVSNVAEDYIIFYAYTDFSRNTNRNLDSVGVRGTGMVFQDKDGILFMRLRFLKILTFIMFHFLFLLLESRIITMMEGRTTEDSPY